MAISVLIVEDDPNIRELLQLYLEKDGYAVTLASDGGQGLAKFRAIKPDLVLLDLMLPEEDGISILKKLRSEPATKKLPIILLTAKSSEYDKVMGLENGADDYVAKPFSMMELLARVKALLRRVEKDEDTGFVVGNLSVNKTSHEVKANGEDVILTLKEFELLSLLLRHSGQVFSREQILSRVWGYDYFGDTRTVDAHIKRIRQKLPQENVPWALKTVYGVGYRFEVNQ